MFENESKFTVSHMDYTIKKRSNFTSKQPGKSQLYPAKHGGGNLRLVNIVNNTMNNDYSSRGSARAP